MQENFNYFHMATKRSIGTTLPKEMTLEQMEQHLVQKHAMLEMNGDPGSAKVIDQIMKVKEHRLKERQSALEEDASKIKPTVVVIPVVDDYDQWQRIAAQQQESLIADTDKIKMPDL